jgi:hypothetical protein
LVLDEEGPQPDEVACVSFFDLISGKAVSSWWKDETKKAATTTIQS